jgi:hypothetical protein
VTKVVSDLGTGKAMVPLQQRIALGKRVSSTTQLKQPIALQILKNGTGLKI